MQVSKFKKKNIRILQLNAKRNTLAIRKYIELNNKNNTYQNLCDTAKVKNLYPCMLTILKEKGD